jgi:hypothetical protein
VCRPGGSSGGKKQEPDKKVSKVAMIKAAEDTIANVSQLAVNAVAAIGKARSNLVESALPFIKNPVAKMVESFFDDLQAKASAESKPCLLLRRRHATPIASYIDCWSAVLF